MILATESTITEHGIRTYNRSESAVFLKTRERYGGLSNMAGGFPLVVNHVKIRSSEALYQACRFPHLSDLQRVIIAQKSPMTAKMKGKPHRSNSRPDWDAVRIKIMRWCLQVKLAQNWDSFSALLLETGDMPIVEHSRRDDFWGAKPVDGETLIGTNALGRLLMELRERVKGEPKADLQYVGPLPIPDFLLYGHPVEPIGSRPNAQAWIQSSLSISDSNAACEKLSKADEEVPIPAQIAETNGNYVLFDDDCPIVNINVVAASDLARAKLPGIGEKLAQRIVDYRGKNGPFRCGEDLIDVPGIGPKMVKKIVVNITV